MKGVHLFVVEQKGKKANYIMKNRGARRGFLDSNINRAKERHKKSSWKLYCTVLTVFVR